MRDLVLFFAAVLSSGECQAAAAPPAATNYSGAGQTVIPLRRLRDGKLLLTATVEGEPLTLMIDTGGSQFLDVGSCRRLGLQMADAPTAGYGLGGPAPVKVAVIDMQLGGISIGGLPTSCIDLGPLRNFNMQQGAPLFDGIIGSELLSVLRARIDYARLILELRRPTTASVADEMRRRSQ
jgi:predicted aspartyl protease